MDNRQFLDITEGFDNIQYVDTPTYKHFWIDENDKVQSIAGESQNRKYKGNVRMSLIKYLQEEHDKGHTVYFFGDPITMYDPYDFSPVITFRMNSYKGRLKPKTAEPIIENKINDYKYLLTA